MPRSRPHHDHDAGGPAELLAAKAELRQEVWTALKSAKATRFPGPDGRIPNFVGAEAAAERLRGTDAWQAAGTLKANPDSPQWPVRQRALEDGKLLFMAVPRLAEDDPFFLLDPEHLSGSAREASSIKGASKSARPVGLDQLRPVDLVVAGTVAAGLDGARLGKGGGFSDLEFAVASEAGLIGPDTVVVTTVHEAQVLPAGEIPTTDHDVPLDLIVTPDRVIRCPRRTPRRAGEVRWEELTDEKIEAIPLLARLRAAIR
jgi:5-formyltetrahydrofolate cyclo-ligase